MTTSCRLEPTTRTRRCSARYPPGLRAHQRSQPAHLLFAFLLQIKQQERELARVEAELDEVANRKQGLQEHIQNVQQELQQSQAVLQERRRELEAEKHLKATGLA